MQVAQKKNTLHIYVRHWLEVSHCSDIVRRYNTNKQTEKKKNINESDSRRNLTHVWSHSRMSECDFNLYSETNTQNKNNKKGTRFGTQ